MAKMEIPIGTGSGYDVSAFGHVVDYKAGEHDPYDLRPAADTIIAAISQKMQDEQDRAKAENRPPRPVVVLFGEAHTCVAHKMLEQLVLQRVQAAGMKPAYGMEFENNFIDKILARDYGLEIPNDKRGIMAAADKTGKWLLQATLGGYKSVYAPEAWHNQLAFCLEKGLCATFNDVARAGKGTDLVLDRRDPRTKALIERYGRRRDQWLPVKTAKPAGMRLRNLMMAESCMEALSQQENKDGRPPMMVQICGGAHLYGENSSGGKTYSAYKDSMVARLKERGALVVPVVLEHWLAPLDLLPREARAALDDAVLVRNLDPKGRFIDSKAALSEHELMEQINEASGGEVRLFNLEKLRAGYKKKIEQQVPKWRRAINSAPPFRP